MDHEPWEKILPVVGLVLAIIVVAELAITWIVEPLLGPPMLRVILTEITFGREAAIPIGLTGHIDEVWLWQITWTVDMVYFCFLYPVVLTVLHRRAGKGGFFMRRIEKLEAAAYKHRRLAHRYGPWGVFLFMLIPFLVNGPLVGMTLGRISGLPTRKLFLPVITANLFTNAVWVFLYDRFFWELQKISDDLAPKVATGVFITVASLAAIGLTIDEWRERRNRIRPSPIKL